MFLISENSLKFANFFCWGNEFSIYGFYHDLWDLTQHISRVSKATACVWRQRLRH